MLRFFSVIWASATNSFERFRHGLPKDYLSIGHKTTGWGGGRKAPPSILGLITEQTNVGLIALSDFEKN